MNLGLTLFFLFMLGLLSAYVAKKQDRNPYIWFFIGFCFGIIGLLVLLTLPFFTQLQAKKKENAPKQVLPSYDPFQRSDWYYLDNKHLNVGPLSFNALLDAWTEQKISLQTYVWRDSMPSWEKIENIPELKTILEKNSH